MDIVDVLKNRKNLISAKNVHEVNNHTCGNCQNIINTSGRARRYTCKLKDGTDFDNDRRGDNVERRFKFRCEQWESKL